MVILRTRNKITDFFMILAWASPFNDPSVGIKDGIGAKLQHVEQNASTTDAESGVS